MEHATRHLYFPYTHEPFPMPKSSENLREFPKTSETLQTRYFYKKRFMKILENLWQSSETFGKL